MEGVQFSYKDPGGETRRLDLRLNPNGVRWSYNLVTNEENTYGGQVIQVLAVNIDRITIEGQFGREGVWGRKVASGSETDRWGKVHRAGSIVEKGVDEQWNAGGGRYGVGLTQMTEFFREYFSFNTQGGSREQPDWRYEQIEMKLAYLNRTFTIVPTEFPSFRRSNDNFAPEWKVVAEVVQPDAQAVAEQKADLLGKMQAAVVRHPEGIGWNPRNPFSDPLVDNEQQDKVITQIVNTFHSVLPGFSKGEVRDMIWEKVSRPVLEGEIAFDPTQSTTDLEKTFADDFTHGGTRG